VNAATSAALPSARQLAWPPVQRPDGLTARDAAFIARLEQDPTAACVIGLVRRFVALVRRPTHHVRQQRVTFASWLADALTCGVRAVEPFAVGLEQDGDAVYAVLTTPWSNGQTEGQITKLKLLKRQMYGRANLDLLRRRVLLAACSTKTAGEPSNQVSSTSPFGAALPRTQRTDCLDPIRCAFLIQREGSHGATVWGRLTPSPEGSVCGCANNGRIGLRLVSIRRLRDVTGRRTPYVCTSCRRDGRGALSDPSELALSTT
jgi:hypothetical protein